MGFEDLIIKFINASFGESFLFFLLIYIINGLMILTIKYSILGKKEKQDVWKNQDFLSKIIYGLIVGVVSWLGGLPFVFLFYSFWSRLETMPFPNIYFGTPIIIAAFLWGCLVFGNNKLKEKTRLTSVILFIMDTGSFVGFILMVLIFIERLDFAKYFQLIFIFLTIILFLSWAILRNKFIDEINKKEERGLN